MTGLARSRLLAARVTVAVAAAGVGACGDDPTAPNADCPGSGGVVFEVSGALDSAASPLSPSDGISGCLRIAAEAAAAGHTSSSGPDVLGYRLRVGAQTWRGSGADLAPRLSVPLRGPVIRFSISADGTSLVFEYGGSVRGSTPSGLLFVIETHAPQPTVLTVWPAPSVGGPVRPGPVGVGPVSFTR